MVNLKVEDLGFRVVCRVVRVQDSRHWGLDVQTLGFWLEDRRVLSFGVLG